MTDGLVQTLRVRGPGAARLGRVAATALPDALDRALSGLPETRIDSLSVLLELDPTDYDDVTLAALWADAIRAELLRHLPDSARDPRLPDAGPGLPSEVGSRPLSLADAVDAARAWLAEEPVHRSVPAQALALAELLSDAPLAAHHEEFAAVLLELAEALASHRHAHDIPEQIPGASTVAQQPPGPAQAEHAPNSNATPGADRQREATVRPGEPDGHGEWSVGHSDAGEVSAAAARVAALAALAEPGARFIDLDTVTTAAGVALLYPWLADLCRSAVDLHPSLDAAQVRAHALAAVVDPHDPTLIIDPLITFLAGADKTESAHAELPHADLVRANAERALASFASLLPGFGQSSPEFVRSEWIRRVGLLDAELDPARLTASTHPLDVVLTRLPYPLSLFKLPWSPVLMVRFRP